jgi:hypothetical protein
LSLRHPQNLFSKQTPDADAAPGQALAIYGDFLTL